MLGQSVLLVGLQTAIVAQPQGSSSREGVARTG
jgi:hypothetical protein